MNIDTMQSGPSLALQFRKNAWLPGIAAAAFAVRAMWAALALRFDPQLVKDPLYGDASGYQVLALNLLAGHGFSWDAIHQTSYRMPGYPAFVAFVYAWLGQEPGFVRLAQAVVGAALCVPVYYIGRDWIGRKLALCAALGTAAFPTLIYMTAWLYSETIYITVLWCGLALVARAITHPSRLHAISGGVVLGNALMIRPEIVAFPLFLFII